LIRKCILHGHEDDNHGNYSHSFPFAFLSVENASVQGSRIKDKSRSIFCCLCEREFSGIPNYEIALDKKKKVGWIFLFIWRDWFSLWINNDLFSSIPLLTYFLTTRGKMTTLESNINDRFKKNFHVMETHITRETFVQGERSLGAVQHELVIAVQQKNLPELKKMIYDRATPGHPLFQKWFNFQEIGEIVKNEEAYNKVKEWLETYGALVTWSSPHKEYIKVVASIATWEEMLSTQFFQFEDLTRPDKSKGRMINRALEYSIPAELKESITVIFNTVQAPPQYHHKFQRRILPPASKADSGIAEELAYKTHLRFREPENHSGNSLSSQSIDSVTVSFLNNYYKVDSNLASPALNQSVFETSSEQFSQSDLTNFQTTFGLTVQAAISIGGEETTTCTFDNCGEGDLDIQYIMGMAQRTASIYWYVPDSPTDPFITWITEVSAQQYPPQSNSISWGGVEQLTGKSIVNQWETEAMKLTGRGVTISVSSGDDGAPNDYSQCLCPGKVTE
jgi:subtilase family serine protease